MPRNGSGNYSLPSVYLATPGTTVRSEQHNVPLQDIQQALTDSLPRNGSAPMTGPLAMGGRRITGLGTPTADGDAASKSYVDTAQINLSRLRMTGIGLLGSTTAPSAAPAVLTLGRGLEFSGSSIRFTAPGAGLVSATEGVALGTPSSITPTSTNSTTSNSHTHEITSFTVRTLIAEADAGTVGTYAWAAKLSGSTASFGDVVSGSTLRPAADGVDQGSGSLPGTWRCMGFGPVGSGTLWMRISS